jgi:hypothetical protein
VTISLQCDKIPGRQCLTTWEPSGLGGEARLSVAMQDAVPIGTDKAEVKSLFPGRYAMHARQDSRVLKSTTANAQLLGDRSPLDAEPRSQRHVSTFRIL